MSKLSHITESGAHMVNVSDKDETRRVAVATGSIRMQPQTIDMIREGRAKKGDVLGVAQVAGIMAAKRTPDIIPMCHPLLLTGVEVDFSLCSETIDITATVRTTGKTGVEMEALHAVSAAALTIYDMVKAVDRGMTIEKIQLAEKSGGASGDWQRATDAMCDDGVCAVPGMSDEGAIDLQALAGIGVPETPTESEKQNADS